MNICLIGPPTVSEHGDLARIQEMRDLAENVPLGVLSLASVLRLRGIEPSVVALNRSYYTYLESGCRDQGVDFCTFATQLLAGLRSDVFGFSTICNSYPLTIRMAAELRRLRPEAIIMMGGPQASEVAEESLRAFPWIDFIVRGEAEETLPKLIDGLNGICPLEQVPGITFRMQGKIVRNPDAPLILDLDALPLPAYDLYVTEPASYSYLSLELGRGCPFSCSFCSTNDFFRRRFRLKSPGRVLEQMMLLENAYGIRNFELVHDMFTVDRKRVVKFCETLVASGKKYGWSCSARTDCVDEPLLELMAKAGCTAIFFGVETGSPRMQKIIDKNLDLPEAARVVEWTQRHGIRTTVSMITGFPEETAEDFRGTVEFLVNGLRYEKVELQLQLLAPAAKTPVSLRFAGDLHLEAPASEICNLGWEQNPLDHHLIRSHPEIFPNFYHLPTILDRRHLEEFTAFFMNAAIHLRWLLLAIHEETKDVIGFFGWWLQWLRDNRTLLTGQIAMRYYVEERFLEDFFLFLRSCYLSESRDGRALVQTMLDYEIKWRAVAKELEEEIEQGFRATESAGPVTITRESIPIVARGVRLLEIDAKACKAIHYLKTVGDGLETQGSSHPEYLCIQNVDGHRIEASTPSLLSARLLTLCDGRLTVGEIMNEFDLMGAETGTLQSFTPQQVCVRGLAMLSEQGLIEFLPTVKTPLETSTAARSGGAACARIPCA
jgi:hypothetical protein